MPETTGCRPAPAESTADTSCCWYDGSSPGSSGRSHICTKRVGVCAPGSSLRSECSTPLPALMRCARPGWITPAFPCESSWTRLPSSTQVTISVSRCGWVS